VTVNPSVSRKPSFLTSKKVQRSNSVMPFMQKKMNRTIVDFSDKKQPDAGVGELTPKEDYPWELSNVNNNNNNNDNSMRRPVEDDSDTYQPRNWAYQQSQNDIEDDYISSTQARFPRSSSRPRQRSEVEDVPDDPYYSGYSARVPNYVGEKKRERASRKDTSRFHTAYRGGLSDANLDPTWLHMKKFQTSVPADGHARRNLSPAYNGRFLSPTRTTVFNKPQWK